MLVVIDKLIKSQAIKNIQISKHHQSGVSPLFIMVDLKFSGIMLLHI
jgi:hypothetical protein